MRLASYRAPNFVFTEHEFELPLDHAQPGGPTITVFAREVVTPAREHDDLPWLVYLQGGPGQRGAAPPEADRRNLVGARAQGLPASAPRPARNRPLDSGRAAPGHVRRKTRPST